MYVQNLNDTTSDVAATITGWTAPKYARSWDEMVRIVWARTNHNANTAARNTIQREYVTGSEVGAIVDAYRRLRSQKAVGGYNPRSDQAAAIHTKIQQQLGASSPPKETIEAVMRNLYDAIYGSPQQVPVSYMTGGLDWQNLTPAEQKAAEHQTEPKAEEPECGLWCTLTGSIRSLFGLPGAIAGTAGAVANAASTTTTIMSIGIPVVVVGGLGFLIYVIGKKASEVDANTAVEMASTRGLSTLIPRNRR